MGLLVALPSVAMYNVLVRHVETATAAAVDEHGRARDITVVEGLSHGLTEAAIAALQACTFTPGEKDGQPVPVRIRGFKIRFLMEECS